MKMNWRKRFIRKLFTFTLKTPYMTLLLIAVIVGILAVTVNSVGVSLYTTSQGSIIRDSNNPQDFIIKTTIENKFKELLDDTCKVRWYLNEESVWYDGDILSIEDSNDKKVSIRFKPKTRDIKKEFGEKCENAGVLAGYDNKIKINLSFGKKQKLIDKILNNMLNK